ncbi:MAG: hypothetical protein ABUS47_03605 [Steroidobacter sp.]
MRNANRDNVMIQQDAEANLWFVIFAFRRVWPVSQWQGQSSDLVQSIIKTNLYAKSQFKVTHCKRSAQAGRAVQVVMVTVIVMCAM